MRYAAALLLLGAACGGSAPETTANTVELRIEYCPGAQVLPTSQYESFKANLASGCEVTEATDGTRVVSALVDCGRWPDCPASR